MHQAASEFSLRVFSGNFSKIGAAAKTTLVEHVTVFSCEKLVLLTGFGRLTVSGVCFLVVVILIQ